MDNLEYIEGYFKSSPTAEEKQQFEERITSDHSFAEEVAFYLSASSALQQQLEKEKKQRFREIYDQRKVIPMNTNRPIRKIIRYLAAACIVAIAFISVWVINGQKTSPQELADRFSNESWKTAGTAMGATEDSLQAGYNLYNEGKFVPALQKFEQVLQADPTSSMAKKYAGISAYQLQQYDTALHYFSLLAAESLKSNPGKFFQAVTLLKRNNAGDLSKAKALLQEVVDGNLENKKQAQQWLEKLPSIE